MQHLCESEDFLEQLSDSNLITQYTQIYAQNLPKHLPPHHFLLMQLRWKQLLSENDKNLSKFNLKLYRPRICNKKFCTFLGISGGESADTNHVIFAFTLEDPPNELVNCIRHTKYINWLQAPLFDSMNMENSPFIQKVLEEKCIPIDVDLSEGADCVWLSKEIAEQLNVLIPDDYYVDTLSEEYIDQINDNWEYGTKNTRAYIETLVKLNKGMGLFSGKEKTLLSWILTNDNFAIGILQTIETERKKGLAKLLLSLYSKHLAQSENIDLFAYIDFRNMPSLKLFQSIGFEMFGQAKWIRVKCGVLMIE